jgi:hypothetical protein
MELQRDLTTYISVGSATYLDIIGNPEGIQELPLQIIAELESGKIPKEKIVVLMKTWIESNELNPLFISAIVNTYSFNPEMISMLVKICQQMVMSDLINNSKIAHWIMTVIIDDQSRSTV